MTKCQRDIVRFFVKNYKYGSKDECKEILVKYKKGFSEIKKESDMKYLSKFDKVRNFVFIIDYTGC